MSVVVLLLLTGVSVGACALLFRIVRAHDKRLLLEQMHGTASGSLESVGISVLVSGAGDMRQIENLLSAEYARYEVVAVLDSRRHPAEFAALVARYRLIRVDHTASEELPSTGVRMMGRSRKRCFRRLVLIDRAQDTSEGDFDAAAAVAAYDYVLPVGAGQYLLPGAVERLAAELGLEPHGSLRALRMPLGEGALLLSREAVVAAGGFGNRPLRHIPRRMRRTVWEPVLFAPGAGCRSVRGVEALFGALLAAGIVAAVYTERWPLAAVLLTGAVVWGAAGCARQALRDVWEPSAGSVVRLRWPGRKKGVKNFTIS